MRYEIAFTKAGEMPVQRCYLWRNIVRQRFAPIAGEQLHEEGVELLAQITDDFEGLALASLREILLGFVIASA